MDTNVSLDEVQYELSAWGHAESLNVLTNVRKGFKRKICATLTWDIFSKIYTPGVYEKEKVWGGVSMRTFA